MDFLAPFRAIGALAGVVRDWFAREERKSHEEKGRLQAREDQWHEWVKADEDMDAVPPGGKRDTVDRLRRGGF